MNLQILKYSILFLLIIFGGYTITLLPKNHTNSLNYDEKVKPGQIWVKTDSIDPFKPIEIDTIKVIDVKKDYSLILINRDTLSVPSKFVTIDSKQIK